MALRIEGYIDDPLDFQFVGTTGRSARNNNPLNLEYRPGSYQDKYGATLEPTGGGKDTAPRFAMFPSMVAGYMAGLDQIRMDQARGHTLASFVNKFAPSFENPTSDLIAQYGHATGASPNTPLANIPAEQLIQPMLKRESSTRIVNLDEVNRQLASYHQMNRPQQPQQEPLKVVGYADEPQPEQPGFLGQAWTGLKEQLGSYLPKYGSFISGAPEATYQQEYQKWKEALGEPEAQPETWWGKVGRGLGQGVGMIPEFAGLAALAPELGIPGIMGRMTQSALPFAASSILNPEAGVGDLAHSVAMGAGLGAIPPTWGRMLRVPAAAGIGGGLGYLSSGDAKQAAADATVLGILSALHGGVPRIPEIGQAETRPDMRGNVLGQRLLPYQEPYTNAEWYPGEPIPPMIPGAGAAKALPAPEGQRLLTTEGYRPDFTMPVETRRRPRGGYQAVVPPENYPLALEKGKGAYTIAPGSYADMVMRAGAELPESAGLRTGPLPGMVPERLAEQNVFGIEPAKITEESLGEKIPPKSPIEEIFPIKGKPFVKGEMAEVSQKWDTAYPVGKQGEVVSIAKDGSSVTLDFGKNLTGQRLRQKFPSVILKPVEAQPTPTPVAKEPWENSKVDADIRGRELVNSIREGEMLLRSKVDSLGKKRSEASLQAIQRSVDNSKAKLQKVVDAFPFLKEKYGEVLKDYPDLAGKVQQKVVLPARTTPIRSLPTGAKKYDIPQYLHEALARAPDRVETLEEYKARRASQELLPSKDQKKYALNAVNEALRGPFEYEGGPSHVHIDIPGDGEFYIKNIPYALNQIAKNFKQFPVGKEPQAPKVSGMGGPVPGQRNTLDKIEDLEYFTPEYKPKRSGYQVPADPERSVFYSNGYYTDGHLLVQMDKAPISGLPKYSKGNLKEIIGKMEKNAKAPANIEGEYKGPGDMGLGSMVLFKGKEGEIVPVKAKYVDYIMENHPDAKPYVGTKDQAVIFKKNKNTVAAVMPLSGEYDYKAFMQSPETETKPSSGGPTPDSLRAGLNLEDLKFLGRKVADLGSWLGKQFDKDTRFKVSDREKGTPRDIHLDPKDLSMWRKFWDMPEWLQKEHPNFLNVAINDWRQKLYNNLKNPWFKEASPVFTLPRQQWDSLKNLIVEADQMSRRMLKTGANREQIDQAVNNLKAQYGPEIQSAAESWWRTGSRIWRTIDDIYSRMGMSNSELDQLRREMGFVPYYFPHMRFGKYLVTVRDGKETLHAEGATNRLTRDRLMADLKKQYPNAKVDYFESKGIAEEVFFGLNDAHAAQLAKAALAKAGKLTPEVEQKVNQALADSLKERGFGRQFIQQKNIPGYETDDFHRVLSNYISGAAGFISKLKAAPEHVKALGAIDAKQQPRLYSYAEKYVRHSLQNASKIDEIAGKMRGLMFHYFLGLNPKSAVLNLTQNIATGAPVLSTLKVSNPGMKILGAVKDLAKDGKAYWDLLHGRDGDFKTLKDNEVRALRTAMNNGWLDDVFTEEMMGMVGSRLGTSLNKFEKASHFLFGQAETLNRAGMFLASFRELTKKGIDFNNAISKANDLTKMSHFAYGKYNLPEPVRDLGPIGRTIYTFRSFSHNYALLLRHLAKNDPAAFGRAIRNLSLLGGLKAVPLVGAAFGVYKALTGKDLWQEAVQDKENNLPYLLARFGIPGLAGIDMSGSVSIEVMKDLKQWSDLPKELLGAVGGIGENLANAADSYKRGDYYRMAENLSPQAVRNVMGAYRKSTEGVTTKTGRQVFDAQGQPVKLTTGEAIEKGLGFQPTRSTIQREINDYLYEMRQNQQDLGDKWATQIINALRNNDKGTYNQVMTEVMDYNQRALKRGEPPIEIENYLKRRMQPQLPGPKKWLPYYQKLQ